MADRAASGEQNGGSGAGGTTVHLFGGPHVTADGELHRIPPGSRRLVCFLALRRGPFERSYVAGTLWPDGEEEKAARNLRGALFRLHRADIFVLEADKWSLGLRAGVAVDLDEVTSWADSAIRASPHAPACAPIALPHEVFDILPGVGDPWVVAERERVRQRVLHALEAVARRLILESRYADAIDAVLPAVAHEPLRESAQAILVDAQLGQGNLAAAQATYEAYGALIRRELGVGPSRTFAARMRAALERPARRGQAGVTA